MAEPEFFQIGQAGYDGDIGDPGVPGDIKVLQVNQGAQGRQAGDGVGVVGHHVHVTVFFHRIAKAEVEVFQMDQLGERGEVADGVGVEPQGGQIHAVLDSGKRGGGKNRLETLGWRL